MLYLVLFVIVAAAAGLWLFFYLLRHEVFGPAARAKQRAKVAEQRAARVSRVAAVNTPPAE